VIDNRLRFLKCAAFVLSVSSASLSFPQSALVGAALGPATLPDAPSSFQQQPQTPTPPQQPSAPAPTPQSSSSQSAQETPGPANETEEQRKARLQKEEAEREVRAEEAQRFGGVIPQFNVVTNGQGVPLTAGQKFNISFHTIIDPYTIGLAVLVGGGLGELEDSHTGYGHGPAGLGKRIASSYADNVNGNLIGNALLPVILKQDPRYFRKGTGSIKSRIYYSAMSTFICKGDNGHTQFNASNVLGNFISGAISNAYYPQDERGVGLTLENGVTVTLEGMVGAQLLEFAPDVTAYVHKRREHHRQMLQQQADAAAAAKAAGHSTTPAATPAPAPKL
jgi:hypothetical protein